jgi:hypothetical protein
MGKIGKLGLIWTAVIGFGPMCGSAAERSSATPAVERSDLDAKASTQFVQPSSGISEPTELEQRSGSVIGKARTADHHEVIESELQPIAPTDAPIPWQKAAYCGDMGCGDIGCGDCVSCGQVGCSRRNYLYAGFEATFLQPRFESDVALTVMDSDGTSFENVSDTEFDYSLEFSPRVFIGVECCDGIGVRTSWWQFDHAAADASAQPPTNGFGRVSTPPFGDVEIAATVPTDTLTASAGLKAYTIDVDLTKCGAFRSWDLGFACGLRYAHIEQHYLAELVAPGDVLQDRIDFQHDVEGFGPTIALSSAVPLTQCVDLFCNGRGSLLFGEGNSRFNAGEDLDLTTPFTTTQIDNRDDLLPIAEAQIGLRWNGPLRCRIWRSFMTLALEGRFWNGVGNASSEEGNLGFFGFTTSAGVTW